MSFVISRLNAEQLLKLEDARKLAASLCDRLPPLSAAEVQVLFDVVVELHVDHPGAVEALGVVFGDMFTGSADFEWAWVEDDWGGEPSIVRIGYDGICHPLSMIEKRISRSERTSLLALREATVAMIDAMIADGRCAPLANRNA
jgi:hypothetical protein